MVKLTIDHIQVEAGEGTTVMEAASELGIRIPSMCHLKGYSNHPSCMICLVKDRDRHHLVPSCSLPVSEGMHILTDTHEVREARKQALELLLSDHVGDCEAPCRISCPAFMDIPLMNRLIAAGDFDGALRIVRQEIALPLVLGYICPAPCEKACKRRPIDQPVSICLLKRATTKLSGGGVVEVPPVPERNGQKVAIIGTGPAGLSAAFYLLQAGFACVLYDQQSKAGGAMQYEIAEDHLPKAELDAEIRIIEQMGAVLKLGVTVTGEMFRELPADFDAVILATGSLKKHPADLFGLQQDERGDYVNKKTLETSLPGVFGCGNIIREQKMAVHSAAQGKLAARRVVWYLETNIHAWFSEPDGHHHPVRVRSLSVTGPLREQEWGEYLKESIPDGRVEAAGGHLAGFTTEEAILEAKRCMHCDCRKPVSCKLRIYGMEYQANARHFSVPERNLLTRSDQHQLVVFETEKCIRCGLCVAITEQHKEAIGLTHAGRGFDVRIVAPFNEPMANALTKTAAMCVKECPTGALAFKKQEERY